MEVESKIGSNVDVIIPGSTKKLRVLENVTGLTKEGKEIPLLKCISMNGSKIVYVEPDILVQGIQKHDEEIKIDYMISVMNDEQHPIDSFVCTNEVRFYKRLSKLLRENIHRLSNGEGLLFSVYRHEHKTGE